MTDNAVTEQYAKEELEKVCELSYLEEMLQHKSATQILSELLTEIKSALTIC